MSQRAGTKEERFLLKLYELANERGDPTTELDRYNVGREMGLHDKGIDHICQVLQQSNFVKKGSKNKAIYLTENGLALVRTLRNH